MARFWRSLAVAAILATLAGCGGGDGGGGSAGSGSGGSGSSGGSGGSGGTGGTGTLGGAGPNAVSVTIDAGPAALQAGPNGYIQDNVPYVSVTVCVPGTSTCQTIDHVEVDTGSVGLRLQASVLDPALLAALPKQTDAGGAPVGECFAYVDGYVFGSVRHADVKIGGESVANMPFQAIADSGVFASAPAACSSGGGSALNTVQALGANGVIGLGVGLTDCGVACASGLSSAATYFSCPPSGCAGVIPRAAAIAAPFQQLPNFAAALASDNNGVILAMPAPPDAGAATLTGTLYFGIGTQSNNGLAAATVYPTTTAGSRLGAGLITVTYKGQALDESYIDSGSNLYVFIDNALTICTGAAAGYYCPSSPLSLSLGLTNSAGAASTTVITLNNAGALLAGSNTALPGIGGNPQDFSSFNPYPRSFALGMPFFFGRAVYTGFEGRTAYGHTGPYFAF